MDGWKIEHMDNGKNNLGRRTNHELSTKSKLSSSVSDFSINFRLVSK